MSHYQMTVCKMSPVFSTIVGGQQILNSQTLISESAEGYFLGKYGTN